MISCIQHGLSNNAALANTLCRLMLTLASRGTDNLIMRESLPELADDTHDNGIISSVMLPVGSGLEVSRYDPD